MDGSRFDTLTTQTVEYDIKTLWIMEDPRPEITGGKTISHLEVIPALS